jgi:predicted regulator of Ras-like GTPase activity (Roadblock/LC7/MglB family)
MKRMKEEVGVMQKAFGGLVSRIGRENPGLASAMLIDAEGRVHASNLAAPELIRAAADLVLQLRRSLERAAVELGYGMLRGTLIEGSEATFALASVDNEMMAVLVGTPGASPGTLRADSLWLADELRRARDDEDAPGRLTRSMPRTSQASAPGAQGRGARI